MRHITTVFFVGATIVGVASCGQTDRVDPMAAARVANESTLVAPGPGVERSVTLEVGGMICQDCADKVQASLARVAGVHSASVKLDDRVAIVVADGSVADSALTGAVRRAGPGYLGLVRH